MDSMKNSLIQQCQLTRRHYTKASMLIIEMESEGFFTQSGAATRQIENFGKQSTNDWFESAE